MNELIDVFGPVLRSPMGLLTGAVVLVVGYVTRLFLKAIHRDALADGAVPLVALGASVVFFVKVGDPALVPYYCANDRLWVMAGYGLVIWLVTWSLHLGVIKRLERRILPTRRRK